MKIGDEVKAAARLDKDNKTLWIKTDALEGYGRVIVESGAWCRAFYEDRAEQTEPQTEQVRCGHYTCHNYEACKNNEWQGCIYEPKTEPQTDCSWK